MALTPMQAVVPSAVSAAVPAATMKRRRTSQMDFFFIMVMFFEIVNNQGALMSKLHSWLVGVFQLKG